MYPLQYCTITLKKESIDIGSFLFVLLFAVSASDLQADAGELERRKFAHFNYFCEMLATTPIQKNSPNSRGKG